MELFSLEDDEGSDLFITQSSPKRNNNVSQNDGLKLLPDGMDFQSPCSSILNAHYSDISDDDFDMHSSQIKFQEKQDDSFKR